MKKDLFTIALMGLLTASCGLRKDKEENVAFHLSCLHCQEEPPEDDDVTPSEKELV